MGGNKKEEIMEEINKISIDDLRPSEEEIKIKLILYAKRFKALKDLLFWVWEHKDEEITSMELANSMNIKKIYALDKLNYLTRVGILEKFGTRPKIFRVKNKQMLAEIIKRLEEGE